MAAEQHNEFVTRAVKQIGRELATQGSFTEQMVALESLMAGLFAASIIMADKTPQEADGFLSALTHGVRGRLPKLLEGRV